MVGAIVGLTSSDLQFDPHRPYTGCRICGQLFQHDDVDVRMAWSWMHSEKHSPLEHYMLEQSGNWCTPEAAENLAPYGIFSLTDMVMSDEISDALRNAKSIPVKEVISVL